MKLIEGYLVLRQEFISQPLLIPIGYILSLNFEKMISINDAILFSKEYVNQSIGNAFKVTKLIEYKSFFIIDYARIKSYIPELSNGTLILDKSSSTIYMLSDTQTIDHFVSEYANLTGKKINWVRNQLV